MCVYISTKEKESCCVWNQEIALSNWSSRIEPDNWQVVFTSLYCSSAHTPLLSRCCSVKVLWRSVSWTSVCSRAVDHTPAETHPVTGLQRKSFSSCCTSGSSCSRPSSCCLAHKILSVILTKSCPSQNKCCLFVCFEATNCQKSVNFMFISCPREGEHEPWEEQSSVRSSQVKATTFISILMNGCGKTSIILMMSSVLSSSCLYSTFLPFVQMLHVFWMWFNVCP